VSAGQAIIAFFIALPKLLDLVEKLGRTMSEREFQAWMNDLSETTEKLTNAQSLADRVAAARRLSDLTARLR
jgi:truncated hemoglobin YjbI